MIGLTVQEYLDNAQYEAISKKVEHNGVSYYLGEINGNTAALLKEKGDDQPEVHAELALITFI